MESQKDKFQLQPLEPRLLLSASGVIDAVVVPPSTAGADLVVKELTPSSQLTTEAGATYVPEGNLTDLLASSVQTSNASQAVAAAPDAETEAPGSAPLAGQTGSTAVLVQVSTSAQDVTSTSAESTAAPVLRTPDQQTKTDEIVATLHGSEPPPASAQNIHLTNTQPLTVPQGLVVESGSTLSGTGTIVGNLQIQGTLSPGSSPGIDNVSGDLTLGSSSSTLIEIGGLNPGPGSPNINDGYDQINVSGTATLGGTLQISLLDGYVPQIGDSFTIMTYGSATGSFSSIEGLIIGNGKVFKIEQGPNALSLVVADGSDILSIIDAVFSGNPNTTFSKTVTPGDVNIGGVLSITSPTLQFDFTWNNGNWTGTITVTASAASLKIGTALTATISDAGSDGTALTGTYTLNGADLHGGAFSLTADKFSLDIPSLLTAVATPVTLKYSPNGLENQELVNLSSLFISITPLQNTSIKIDNLSIQANGFSIGNAQFSTEKVTLGSVLSIDTLTLTFKDVSYTAGGSLAGTFEVSASSVSLFPGHEDMFVATVTNFTGSYTLGTSKLELGAGSVDIGISDLLKLTATMVTFKLDPFIVNIGGVEVSSPRFSPQLKGTVTGLTITSKGFSVTSATVAYTGSLSLGSVLTASNLTITATQFGYTVGSGTTFDGSLTVTVGSVALFPGKSVNASATGVTVTVNLAPQHVGELSFSADTVSFKLASVFEASATSVSINASPGPGEYAFSFSSITAGLPSYGISGTLGNTSDPTKASFGFDANGVIQLIPGGSFGFSYSTASADAAQKLKWPSWLPVQISGLSINWPDITANPADFVLTFSASVNLSQLKGAPLSLSGSVTDIVIDVGKLINLEFPIISVGGVTVSVTGSLFGGTISATLIAGVVRFDSEGFEVNSSNKRVSDGTDAVGAITSAFYAGIRGGFSMAGLSGFKLSIGLSEFGPLSVYVAVTLPTGIILEPISGLTINGLRGGVEFNQTLPNLPIDGDGTAEDALQLRNGTFDSPVAKTDAQWEADLRGAVGNQLVLVIAARAQGKADPDFWNVFAFPMIIRAGATFYSQYTSDKVFRAEIDLALDTRGRIFISGDAVFADSVRLSIRLFANLSAANVTFLFLSDFPKDFPTCSVYGRADFLFSRTDGEAVTTGNRADQFEIRLAGVASVNVLNQLEAKFSGSVSLAVSPTGFVIKADALLNVTNLGDIGSAAGELHVQTSPDFQVWGAFLITVDFSAMEKSGIYVAGQVFFSLNTTSVPQPITLKLPSTTGPPTVYNRTLKPTSFGFMINGTAVLKLPDSTKTDPGLLSMQAALVVDVDASQLTILAVGSMDLKAGDSTLLSFDVNGLLVVNSAGVAARLTLDYANGVIPGVEMTGKFHLVINTTKTEVTYQIPTLDPAIPEVTGPDLSGNEISLEQTINGTGRWIVVPAGAPKLGDRIDTWDPAVNERYVVIFGAGTLKLLDTFSLDGSLLLIVSPSQLAMSVSMKVDLSGLGQVTAAGSLLIDSQGIAGSLTVSGQTGSTDTGNWFTFTGTAHLLVNTRPSAVPALDLPAGPYVQVGVSGTLIIGPSDTASFKMVGNFILTENGALTEVTASAMLTATVSGVTVFSMQADGSLVMSSAGVAAKIVLGTGGMGQGSFQFSGYFTLEVNTTPAVVDTINGKPVNLPAGPYVHVLIAGDPSVPGSTATLALTLGSGTGADANSVGMNGTFELEMSEAGLEITSAATLFVKLAGSELFSLSANGALLVTSSGIAAKISLGIGDSESTAANGFSFNGYFTLELNTGGQPVAQIGTQTVNLAAGPYVRLTIGGDPNVAGSKAALQLIIGGENGFLMEGTFVLDISDSGIAVTATTTLKAVVGGTALFSVDANGALLITKAGIAAMIEITPTSINGLGFDLSGTFILAINTTSTAVSTINNVVVNLPAGPFAYLSVAGGLSLPGASGLSLTGAFYASLSSAGLVVFASASFSFGPSIAAFTFDTVGVLIVKESGVAGDLDITMTVGSSLSSVMSAANISARFVFNTTGADQNVVVPASFLPLLSQKTRDRLTGTTVKTYVVYGGAPKADGSRADPGAYVVVTFDATLTLGGFWNLEGHFRLAAAADYFELSAKASLDLLFLGHVDAAGFVSITGAGIAGKLSISGRMETFGFSVSAAASFEVNTTGAAVNGVQPGYLVSFTGTLTFVGFCEATAEGFVRIDATGLQLHFDGTFTIGPLSFNAAAFVGVFEDGVVLDAEVDFNTNILSLFNFDFTGKLQVNTTSSRNLDHFDGPSGRVSFKDSKGNPVTILHNSFYLEVQASLSILSVINVSGGLTVKVVGNSWRIDIAGLDASLFGIMTIKCSGYLESSGHFDLTFTGGVGLPYYGASTGVDGTITLRAWFDGTTFAFSVSGGFNAKFEGITLAGVSVTMSVSGTLGQSVSLDLSVSGTGVVLETVLKIVRVTLDYAESIGATIVNVLGQIGCTIASWFGLCDTWVDIQVPSNEWVEKLLTFTIHLATIQLPGSLQNSTPPAPNLADVSGGVLTLNVGSRAALRTVQPGNADETFSISHVSGSAGDETVIVTAFGVSETYAGVSSISADFGDGNDSFLVSSGVLAGATVYGGAGNDSLAYSGSGSATLSGQSGNDTLTLGSDVSGGTVYGGDGNDSITAEISGGVGVLLYGDAGNDTLTGGFGSDVISGGDGNDILQGRGGVDVITGGAGNDTLTEYLTVLARGASFDGGTGTDQLKLLGTSGANSFRAGADGSTQVRLSSCSGSTELAYLLGTSVETLILDGQGGADSFALIGNLRQAGVTVATVNLGGDAGADSVTISLSDQADTLKLADYAVTPNSLAAIWSGHTVYNMLSVSSQDTLMLLGGDGNDLLCGDTVTLSPFGQISLYGEGGDDVLCGTNQNDLLNGGLGNDFMAGKAGTDIFQDAGGYNILAEVFDGDFGLFGNLFIEGTALLSGSGESRELVSFTNATVEDIAGIFSEVRLVGSMVRNIFAVGAAAGVVNANGAVLAATPWNALAKLNGVGGDDEYLVELRGCSGAVVQVIEYSQVVGGQVTQQAGGNDVVTFKGTDLPENGNVSVNGDLTMFALTPGMAQSQVVTNSDIESTSLYLLGGDDTLAIQSIGVAAFIAAGAGNDRIDILSLPVALTVSCGTGDDTVNVGSLAPSVGGVVDGIVGQLVVSADDGTDVLKVDDTGDAADNSGQLSPTDLTGLGMGVGIHYLDFEQLNIGLGLGNDTFTIADTHAGQTTLSTNDGADVVNVRATSGQTSVYTNNGNDIVNVQSIGAPLAVTTGAGDDVVNVQSTGADMTVDTGDDNDIVNVQSIGALMTVSCGAGDDTVNVGSLAPDVGGVVNGIVGQLVVSADDGTDVLNVDDSGDTADNTGLLTPTDLTGLGMGAGIHYLSFELLNIGLGLGNDSFTIADTHAGQTTLSTNDGADVVNVQATSGQTSVYTNNGNDIVNVSSDAPLNNGTLDNLQGELDIDCGAGINTLNVSDEADVTGDVVLITESSIVGFSPAAIMYQATGGTFGGGVNIEGGSGGNSIEIQSTNDSPGTTTTLWSGEGSDYVLVTETDPLSLVIHGEAGNDVIFAAVVTTDLIITGDDGDDFITSGSGDDWISGNDGNDVIIAALGNDFVSGGPGNDLVTGDDGIATWIGAQVVQLETANPSMGGNDVITGDSGNDVIFGGAGRDTIDAGEGADIVLGDNGRLSADGALCIDTAANLGAPDQIHGGPGDDLIMGEQGDDLLYGDEGDDDIIGGSNVRFAADGSDFIEGGDGSDVVLGDNGTISRRLENGQAEIWQTYPAPFADVIRDVTLFDDVDNVAGNDVIFGGAGNDVLHGQRGNDQLFGGCGDDEMTGGLGDDLLVADEGNDILVGDTGVISRAWNADGSPRMDPNGSWHKDVLLTGVGVVTGVYYPGSLSCADLNADLLLNLLDADLVLLMGAYNADGTPYTVKVSPCRAEQQICLLLVTLLPDGNDTLQGGTGDDALMGGRGNDLLAGGDGADFMAGGAGDDTLDGGTGNDVLVGDDVTRVTSGDALPNVRQGLHLVSGGAGYVTPANIVMADLGAAIVPMASVVPGSRTDVLSSVLGYLSGAPSLPAGVNRLVRADGTWLLPFASFVTDVAHHTDLVAGNDLLVGGDGDDIIVGDSLSVFTPTVAVSDPLIDSALAMERDLSGATEELGELLCRLDHVLDDATDHLCISHRLEVVDSTFIIGSDSIDGGSGNDLLVGDDMAVSSPTFVVPLGLLADYEDLVDCTQGVAAGFDAVLAQIDDAAHDLREVLVSVKCGRRTELNLEQHIDNILAGSDSILGGDGNDLVMGDGWTVVTPALSVVLGGSACHHHHDCGGCGFRGWHSGDELADTWMTGNDSVDAGAGNDVVFGDSAAWVAAQLSVDPAISKCAFSRLRSVAYDALDDLAEMWLGQQGGSGGWFRFGDCDGSLYLSRGGSSGCGKSLSGNDRIHGGDGDDLLFGQGGDDSLWGNAGNDWLFGGDGHDSLDGGPGCDRVDHGWGCWDWLRHDGHFHNGFRPHGC